MPYTSYGKRNGTAATIYGVEVDSEKPITGVVQNNNVEWLGDAINEGIDLAFEEHASECAEEYHDLCYDGAERGDTLIGDWLKDKDGKYIHNIAGEYAAIVRESVTHVVYSKHTKRCRPCSPCYPGQGDLDSPDDGGFLAYDLPPGMYAER